MVAVSDQERAIRADTVTRIRQLWPDARVIHELNVEKGVVRADIAAVTRDQLFLFEVKSERDKLHRLSKQIQHFHPVCHGLVVVAHEKWCGRAAELGYPNCDVGKIIRHHSAGTLWQWPEPEGRYFRHWDRPPTLTTPWHHRMLRLLWTDELRAVAKDVGVTATARAPGYQLANLIAAQVPGAKIEAAVCAALRARAFAWADEPAGRVAA